MGTIQPRPRGGASLSGELRQERKDREQQRRQRVAMPKPALPVLVQISDKEDPSWPVGTAWLDTSGEG